MDRIPAKQNSYLSPRFMKGELIMLTVAALSAVIFFGGGIYLVFSS